MRRHDILDALICAGCPHLVVKILGYLDSQSLLAASLVSHIHPHSEIFFTPFLPYIALIYVFHLTDGNATILP